MRGLRRAVILVVDSCGVGAAPDAADYGDEGADTVGHTAAAVGGLDLPNFAAAGLGNLHGAIEGVPPVDSPTMAYGRLREASAGKDSTTGHWEIAGVITTEPHATFPDGFPADLVARLEAETGHTFIGNYPASGTVIIDELGEQHAATASPILYTSADSVLQIAAHKEVVPLEELYRICAAARDIANDYRIGRIIARPFEGDPGSYHRTYERHDYAMPPPALTLLDHALRAGLEVVGVGKIEDLFAGRGLSRAVHTEGDLDGMKATRRAIGEVDRGIVMTNLVDLDMRYGHREDPVGYAAGLALIDEHLPHLVDVLGPDDMMIVTADHGTDPTDGDTNHSREYVPLLVHAAAASGVDLGTRRQYCDVAATVGAAFGLDADFPGSSFWAEVS
jgi:phosphopentomutase